MSNIQTDQPDSVGLHVNRTTEAVNKKAADTTNGATSRKRSSQAKNSSSNEIVTGSNSDIKSKRPKSKFI